MAKSDFYASMTYNAQYENDYTYEGTLKLQAKRDKQSLADATDVIDTDA